MLCETVLPDCPPNIYFMSKPNNMNIYLLLWVLDLSIYPYISLVEGEERDRVTVCVNGERG